LRHVTIVWQSGKTCSARNFLWCHCWSITDHEKTPGHALKSSGKTAPIKDSYNIKQRALCLKLCGV
jgi:hypothetical protein